MKRSFTIQRSIMAGLALCLVIGMTLPTASIGADDIRFGATDNRTGIAFSMTNDGNCLNMLTNHREAFSFLSGGGFSGCFISASVSELAGIGVIFGLCFIGLLIGLKLVINDPPEEEVIEKVK